MSNVDEMIRYRDSLCAKYNVSSLKQVQNRNNEIINKLITKYSLERDDAELLFYDKAEFARRYNC